MHGRPPSARAPMDRFRDLSTSGGAAPRNPLPGALETPGRRMQRAPDRPQPSEHLPPGHSLRRMARMQQRPCPGGGWRVIPRMAMPVFKIVRFAIRPDACTEVEQAMREFALYVGLELEDSSWTTYRDRRNPNVYVTLITADDEDAVKHQRTASGSVQFARVLQTRLLTDVDTREYELVATSRGGL